MLLAIDIGNTNVTIGIVDGGCIEGVRRTATNRASTTDELEILLRDLLALDDHDLNGATAMAVASVVPAMTALVEAVAARLGIPTLVATAGTVPIADPGGPAGPRGRRPDRQRARGRPAPRHPRPSCATSGPRRRSTASAADGAFVGGAIAPGLELGLEALAARTAKLPRVELRTPDRVIGRDTVSAIQSGTVFGYQALVAGLLARARAELADAGRDRARGRAHDPHRRAVRGAVGPRRRRRRPHRPGPHASGPRDPRSRGRGGDPYRDTPPEDADATPDATGTRSPGTCSRSTRSRRDGPARGPAHRPRRVRVDRRLQGRRAPAPAARRGRRRRRHAHPVRGDVRRPAHVRRAHRATPVETDVLGLLPDQRIGHIVVADTADAIVVAPATARWLGAMANGIANDVVTATCLATVGAGRLRAGDGRRHVDAPRDARQRRPARSATSATRWSRPETGPLASGQEGVGRLAELPRIVDAVVEAIGGRPVRAARRRRAPAARRPARDPGPRGPARRRERRRHRGGDRPRPVHRQPQHRQDGRRDRGGGARPRRRRHDRRGPRRGPAAGCRRPSSRPSPPPTCATPSSTPSSTTRRRRARDGRGGRRLPPGDRPPRRSSPGATGMTPRARAHARTSSRRSARAPATSTARPVIVGFAAETGSLERAPEKLRRKGADLLVANDVSEPGSGFGTDTNRVVILGADGSRDELPLLDQARGRGPPAGPGRRAVGRPREPRAHWPEHPRRAHERPDRDRPPPVGPRHREALRRRRAHRHDHRLRLPDRRDRRRGGHPADPRRGLPGAGRAGLRHDRPRDDGRDAPPHEGRGAGHEAGADRRRHAVPLLLRPPTTRSTTPGGSCARPASRRSSSRAASGAPGSIEALVKAGIPVMGHIGLTPQAINTLGKVRVQGKNRDQARQLLADALAVQEAGAFAVVLELVPEQLAAAITERLRIPTIGIGAGAGCSGQIQVINDTLGYGDWTPKHARKYADLHATILERGRAVPRRTSRPGRSRARRRPCAWTTRCSTRCSAAPPTTWPHRPGCRWRDPARPRPLAAGARQVRSAPCRSSGPAPTCAPRSRRSPRPSASCRRWAGSTPATSRSSSGRAPRARRS